MLSLPLAPAAFQVQPNHSATIMDEGGDVTVLCQWRAPKKRKESTISEARFKKHDYARPAQQKVKIVILGPQSTEEVPLVDYLTFWIRLEGNDLEFLCYLIVNFVHQQLSHKHHLMQTCQPVTLAVSDTFHCNISRRL